MVQYTYSSHRTRRIEKIKKQRVKYPSVAKNIVDTSDIILEVLDARFLEETRNKELEEEILRQKKKIIYVLNKADLVKASRLQEIKGTVYPYAIVSCTQRRGIKDLRDLIKRVAKTVEKREMREILKDKVVEGNEKRIKVGVIGYPNAGKSSLLNIIAGKSAAGVGADAGFTKNVQKIRLTDDIVLIDSPGVIPEEQYSLTDKEKIAEHSLAGGKSYTQVKEPDMAVMQLYKKYKKELEEFYGVESDYSDDLIEKVGLLKGILKKGGDVNEDAVAREILRAWQFGEIKAGKSNFELESVTAERAREEAEESQTEDDYELGEIIDEIAESELSVREQPIRIADLYAGSHADRYEKIFRILRENKENQFDWVDNSEFVLGLAKEYIEAGNLLRRLDSLNFVCQDSVEYLKSLKDGELDLVILKNAVNYVDDLNEFFELISKKLGEGAILIGTLVGDVLFSDEDLKSASKKYGLDSFIGNWKSYVAVDDSDLSDCKVLILEKD